MNMNIDWRDSFVVDTCFRGCRQSNNYCKCTDDPLYDDVSELQVLNGLISNWRCIGVIHRTIQSYFLPCGSPGQ